jgi:sodium-dependent dicarboxylate transporter 2/3/5
MNSRKFGLFLGAALFIIMRLLPVPEGMKAEAWAVAAVTVLMAAWWITEAIPIPATSLLPILLYPILGVLKPGQATTAYANEVVYLFIGGFFLAVAMEHWNLHRRIALQTVRIVGTSPTHMILGFMIAVGFLSMWISNTACAVMMVPIGIAVVSQITGLSIKDLHDGGENKKSANFAKALMIGIAYAASIGGVATLIGTPPNSIMKGMVLNMYKIDISFVQWLIFGLPFSIIMLAVAWFLLTKILFRTGDLKLAGSRELIDKEIQKLGPMSRAEKSVAAIGILMAVMWISRGFIKIDFFKTYVSDTTVAMIGAMLLFLVPVDWKKGIHILEWKTAVKIPWDIVLLFGGGFAIANGFQTTQLAHWLSAKLTSLNALHMVVFVLIIALLVTFLTEITSNTATATLLIPIMGAAAVAMGIHPFATIVTACISASMAFMLPVATPPNAVVFGSGYLKIKDMAYAGILLNIFGAILITLMVTYLLPILWGVDLSTTPQEIVNIAK